MSNIFEEYQKLKKELHEKTNPPTVFDRYEQLKEELDQKRRLQEEQALERLETLMSSLTSNVPPEPKMVLEEPVDEPLEPLEEDVLEEIVEVQEIPFTIPLESAENHHTLHEAVYDDSRLIKRIENLERRLGDIIMSMPPAGTGGGDNNLFHPATVYTDYTSLGYSSKDLILCDTLENDIVVTLPDTRKNHGWKIHVKKMHRNNQVYIRGYNNTQLIDQQEQVVINTQYVTLQMVCDSSQWYIV